MSKIFACCVIAACCPSALNAALVPAQQHMTEWHGPAVAEKAPLAIQSSTPSDSTPVHDGPAIAERADREISVAAAEPIAPAIAEKAEKPAPQFDQLKEFDGPAVAERATHRLVPEPIEIVGPAVAEKPARDLPPAIAEKAPHAAPVIEVQVAESIDSANQHTGRMIRIATAVAPHVVPHVMPKVWLATQWLITR